MSTKPVNGQALAMQIGPRPGSRYSMLARHLTEQIQSGHYKVGHKMPTEAELQQRYDVSRHTVREALRDLKGQGLVVARAGVGTVVRARAPRTRFMQGVGTLRELIQFVEATRMRVLKTRQLIVDDAMAARFGMKPGGQWHEASVLRFLPNESVPVASMFIYVRPEHADVLGMINSAHAPVFSLIERLHGVRICEVSQQIVAVVLTPSQARVLKARPRMPALEITRRYTDAQDRIAMVSVGLYPSDRFSHNTKFRIENADPKEISR